MEFAPGRRYQRFLHAYLLGYWTDRNGKTGLPAPPSLFKEGENTPFAEIGTCRDM